MHQSFDELVKIQKLKLHNLVTTMLSYEQKGLATAIVLKFIINKSSCQRRSPLIINKFRCWIKNTLTVKRSSVSFSTLICLCIGRDGKAEKGNCCEEFHVYLDIFEICFLVPGQR